MPTLGTMRRMIKVYVTDRDYEAFAASAKAEDRSLSTWMYRAAEAFKSETRKLAIEAAEDKK
jgi:hypothetical protein